MKMEEIMVPCKKCGNKAPASAMKLDLDEKLMICPDCIKNKKIHKQIEKEVFHKESQEQPQMQAHQQSQAFHQAPAQEERQSKIAHKCTSCNYKFKIDPETRTPKYCPYCNARVMGI